MKKSMKMLFCLVAFGAAVVAAPAPSEGSGTAAGTKDKPYPLTKCIVSDEKLGEMGDPYVFSYKGQEIKLCCKSCKKDFTKNPDKYLKKLADASKAKK